MWRNIGSRLAVGLTIACNAPDGLLVDDAERTTDEESALALGRAFSTPESGAFRRGLLESSLLVADNTYARLRLDNYATEAGWDQLPEFDPEVAALSDVGGTLQPGVFQSAPELEAWSHAALMALGRWAFERYPAQRHFELGHVFAPGRALDVDLAQRYGLWSDPTGWLGGLVVARYADGTEGVALTCATCHARVDAGIYRLGAPSDLDLTALGRGPIWGPGRVDTTPDGVDNPVAIADLRATRLQTRLHHTGNLKNGLGELAVRIETLLITSAHQTVRPPRTVAFALAYFIWHLSSSSLLRPEPSDAATRRGAESFNAKCRGCHRGEYGEGDWASLEQLEVDALAALSPERGSGGYRVPALAFACERRLSHAAYDVGVAHWLMGAPGRAAHPGKVELSATQARELEQYICATFTPEPSAMAPRN